MLKLFDRVLHVPTRKACFIIDIDEGEDDRTGETSIIYGLEAEDQDDNEWFYWAEENELEKLPENQEN